MIIAVVYLLAMVVGCVVFVALQSGMQELGALLAADVVATIVGWGFGLLFGNVSVYDPYWSVAPPVIFTAWVLHKGMFTLPALLLLIAVWDWGIRLTCNRAYTFQGMNHEDWRYTN